MRPLPDPVLFIVMAFLSAFAPASGADSAAKVHKVAITELAAKFRSNTQEVSAKLKEWSKCIGEAEAARSLKDYELSRERSALDTVEKAVKENRFANAESYLGISFGSLEPARLMAVKKALQVTLRSREEQCVVPLGLLFRQICRDAAGTWKVARSPEDLASVVELLAYFKQTIPDSDQRDTKGSLPIDEAVLFLDRTSSFFAGDPVRPVRAMVSEIMQLTRSGEQLAEQISTTELDVWRENAMRKFAVAVDGAEERMRELMMKEVSAKEFHEGLIAFERTIDRSREANSQPDALVAVRARNEFQLYADWGAALSKAEIQDWEAALQLLDEKRYAIATLSPEIVRSFSKKRAECKVEIAKAIEAETESARRMWADKLAGIQSAADATSVATEVAAWIQKMRIESRRSELLQMFAAELNGLGSIWAKIDSSRTQHFQSLGKTQNDFRTPHPWTKDLALLRERIIRNELARLGPAPELLAVPLRDLPLGEAVNKMTADLARQGDWERNYSVLYYFSTAYGGSASEEAAAIKSFLTAQRLEKGAIFRLAAVEYRAVLDCVSDRVPIQQATERMSELNAKHPEVFEAMAKKPARTN